jgi:hypothetical protein
MVVKWTKWPNNIPKGCKMDQMATQYAKIFDCKTLQNLTKLGFMVSKCTICPRSCHNDDRWDFSKLKKLQCCQSQNWRRLHSPNTLDCLIESTMDPSTQKQRHQHLPHSLKKLFETAPNCPSYWLVCFCKNVSANSLQFEYRACFQQKVCSNYVASPTWTSCTFGTKWVMSRS